MAQLDWDFIIQLMIGINKLIKVKQIFLINNNNNYIIINIIII